MSDCGEHKRNVRCIGGTCDDRGERYADGGFATVDVFYPDPARIAQCHAEWAGDPSTESEHE